MVKFLFFCFVAALACKPPSTYWSTVEPIIEAMSLEQLIGQMTQGDVLELLDSNSKVDPSLVTKYDLGSVLVSANAAPDGAGGILSNDLEQSKYLKATMANWQSLATQLNQPVTVKDYAIHPLLGTDAVHGNQHVLGEVLFPHNIGLAATHNASHFNAAGSYTGASVRASGWNYAFAPTVAVSHSFYWGRHYETMGAEYQNVTTYAEQYVLGLQNDNGKGEWSGVLASAKHFLGDGATYHGVDEGNVTSYSTKNFMEVNAAGYKGAKTACVGSVMASYSAVNQIAMSMNSFMLQGVLKEGLFDGQRFDGFVISDYGAIQKVADQAWPTKNYTMDTEIAIANMISAGVDMFMLSVDSKLTIADFQSIVLNAYNTGLVHHARVVDAVKRILGVKCALGLIDGVSGCPKPAPPAEVKASDAAQAATKAAQESLVLLKNSNDLLPVDLNKYKYIVLTGERDINELQAGGSRQMTTYQDFNNVGAQCGGWTMAWQGYNGNFFWTGDNAKSSAASTLLSSITSRITPTQTTVIYNEYQNPASTSDVANVRSKTLSTISAATDMTKDNTLVIAVLAENPYAEYMGDINNPFCLGTNSDTTGCLFNQLRNAYLPTTQEISLNLHFEANSQEMIDAARSHDQNIELVTVLFSGRPRVVTGDMEQSGAFVAAWLPGTTGGEAVVSALTGEYLFKSSSGANTLPVPWLADESALVHYPIYSTKELPSIKDPLYKIGYGLATKKPTQVVSSLR